MSEQCPVCSLPSFICSEIGSWQNISGTADYHGIMHDTLLQATFAHVRHEALEQAAKVCVHTEDAAAIRKLQGGEW